MATNNAVNTSLSGQTGTGTFVGATTPTLVTPVLGAATATSINFGGSTLSSYVSETSWTPVFTFATPGNLSVAYATQVGIYTRIGNLVYLNFNILFTPTFTTSSGLASITGLPFTSAATSTASVGALVTTSVAFNAGATSLACVIGSASSNIQFDQSGTGIPFTQFSIINFATGTQYQMVGSLTYFI